MAFELILPDFLRKSRWKVKIRDKETREPPHATIIRGTNAWRINLRTGDFMDASPAPGLVPSGLVLFLRQTETWDRLCREWDRMYPGNPVSTDLE